MSLLIVVRQNSRTSSSFPICDPKSMHPKYTLIKSNAGLLISCQNQRWLHSLSYVSVSAPMHNLPRLHPDASYIHEIPHLYSSEAGVVVFKGTVTSPDGCHT